MQNQHGIGSIGFPDGSVVKNLPANAREQEIYGLILGQEDLLEEEMATHSGKILWRRKKKPTPVFSASLVAQMVKSLPAVRETRVRSLGWKIPLEKEMATHSSILAWKIPWMEKPGGLQSMGSLRVGHSRVTSLSLSSILTWRIPWREEPGGLQSMGSQT